MGKAYIGPSFVLKQHTLQNQEALNVFDPFKFAGKRFLKTTLSTNMCSRKTENGPKGVPRCLFWAVALQAIQCYRFPASMAMGLLIAKIHSSPR